MILAAYHIDTFNISRGSELAKRYDKNVKTISSLDVRWHLKSFSKGGKEETIALFLIVINFHE